MIDYTMQGIQIQLELCLELVYNCSSLFLRHIRVGISRRSNPTVAQTVAFHVGGIPVDGDLVLAPLAGYSDQPFRGICRSMGSAMSYTEFVSSAGMLSANHRTLEILRFRPRERPVVFQVFGSEPEQVIRACLRLEQLGPDIIDINMGCPARRIAAQGGGAGLLREPAKIARIFGAASRQLSTPVSGKIRLGWDQASRNYLDVARILEDNGASLIAVHARTRAEGYSAPADWDAIAEIKRAVHIPVLGNGDVQCVADIEEIKSRTGCNGVMIGRAAIGNPWIFQRRDLVDVPMEERIGVIRSHLAEMVSFYGERRGVVTFRKHIVRYLRGLPNASHVRPRLMLCSTPTEVLDTLERFLQQTHNVL
jgi:nifR3 family TIM-barrel protein